MQAGLEHRQVVQGVARYHDGRGIEAGGLGQAQQRRPLADAARQHVEVAAGRQQQVAAEGVDRRPQRGRDLAFGDQEGTAPLLRHALAAQAGEAGQGFQDRLRAGPVRGDFLLDVVDRAQVAVDDGGADVGNDVIGDRNGRVAQQRQDRLEAAAGDEHQAGAGLLRREQLAHAAAAFRAAGQQGAVEIGGKYNMIGLQARGPSSW